MQRSPRLDARRLQELTNNLAHRLRLCGARLLEGSGPPPASAVIQEAHLFSGGPTAAAYGWMVSTVQHDPDALVMAYEAYIEQPLGATRSPGAVIEKVLNETRPRSARGLFNLGERSGDWMTPVVRLIAAAQLTPGCKVDADLKNSAYTARIGPHLLTVSPWGAYSNIRGTMVQAVRKPTDLQRAPMLLRSVRTTDPVLAAIQKGYAKDPDVQLWLRLFVDQPGQSGGQIRAAANAMDFTLPIAMDGRQRKRLPGGQLNYDDPDAVQAGIDLTYSEDEDVLRQLYLVLVPTVFSSKEFANCFGSMSAQRRPRESTRGRWRELILSRA